jgi:hypothetical protein
MDTLWAFLTDTIHQLLGRASGPLHFRLFVMPIVVTIMAIRAHLRDVREGKPIFLWAFLKDPSERQRLFRSGLKDFGKVFIVACVLDTAYQLFVLKEFHIAPLLVVAVACALVPYFFIRGPVTRIVTLLHRRWCGAAAPPATTTKPPADNHEKQERSHE